MEDHWELLDLLKAGLSIVAGMILGLERELKDKAAGLKTITIITLGATLFTIISYKVGGIDRGTAIAAYIVSGVGFIGAGVIFKDGIGVTGLTTAGIIWLAAAIGTSIGFGEFYVAATFLGAAMISIFVFTPLLNYLFVSKKLIRQLEFELEKKDITYKAEILAALKDHAIEVREEKVEMFSGRVKIYAEVVFLRSDTSWLENYLLTSPVILSFKL